MKLILEIRPGEGGEDAKLLVSRQAKLYSKFGKLNNANVSIEDSGRFV